MARDGEGWRGMARNGEGWKGMAREDGGGRYTNEGWRGVPGLRTRVAGEMMRLRSQGLTRRRLGQLCHHARLVLVTQVQYLLEVLILEADLRHLERDAQRLLKLVALLLCRLELIRRLQLLLPLRHLMHHLVNLGLQVLHARLGRSQTSERLAPAVLGGVLDRYGFDILWQGVFKCPILRRDIILCHFDRLLKFLDRVLKLGDLHVLAEGVLEDAARRQDAGTTESAEKRRRVGAGGVHGEEGWG